MRRARPKRMRYRGRNMVPVMQDGTVTLLSHRVARRCYRAGTVGYLEPETFIKAQAGDGGNIDALYRD